MYPINLSFKIQTIWHLIITSFAKSVSIYIWHNDIWHENGIIITVLNDRIYPSEQSLTSNSDLIVVSAVVFLSGRVSLVLLVSSG